MKFAKAIWKLLVGVKDALVLLLMLLFFGVLYVGLSARPAPITDGVLALELEGAVVEQPSRPTFADLAGGGRAPTEYRLRDLVAALEAARDDDRVKAVALDLEWFTGGGQVAMIQLADAVRDVRKSGKPVIAYAPAYGDDSYLVASAATEVWLDPLGGVAIAGPGGPNLYFRGLLDKLGITPNVYRVGSFKSAVEPFTRSDMSDEARQNAQALGDALLEQWTDEVRKNRPKARIEPYMRDPLAALQAAGGDLARAATGFGLVDKIASRDAFEARLAKLGGSGDAKSPFRRIEIGDYVADTLGDDGAGSIGVVTVAGMIVDGEAPAGTAGGDSIAEIIDTAVRKGGLKALVVRVDSPGGSVLASERIRQAILGAKRKGMPVVVSMGNVAASGGYWVSTPADFIFAEPSTITGSIGVFGILPSFEGTLQKLGIGADGIRTTPLSGEPDLLNGPSAVADSIIQASVESIYRRFLQIVSRSRNKPPAAIDRIAQGRVWDGGTARQLGLVDGFGGLDQAVEKAGELAKIDDPLGKVRFLERPVSFEERLLEMLADDRSSEEAPAPDALAVLAPDTHIAWAIAELRSVLSGPRIQLRCLECPPSAPARLKKEDVGFIAALRDWLS